MGYFVPGTLLGLFILLDTFYKIFPAYWWEDIEYAYVFI